MIDETDLSEECKWRYEKLGQTAVTNLQKRNIEAQYVPNRQEAFSLVMGMIPRNAKIVRGDSISMEQIGVIEELGKQEGWEFIDPFQRTENGDWFVADEGLRLEMFREAFRADVFLTGTNAITLDGKLVNTDAHGNRVSAMIFGPSKVIVVAGANKIVRDFLMNKNSIRADTVLTGIECSGINSIFN